MTNKAPMTRVEIRKRLNLLPRLQLGHLPTPLEELHNFREYIGGPRVLVKRDDATGLAFGGNKVRHYEFEMAYLREGGYDTLVNVMDYHSNNARVTGAAANKVGIRYVLVLRNAKGRPVQGNLLVDKILGAELHLLDEYESKRADEYAHALGRELEQEGHKPYVRVGKEFPQTVGIIAYIDAGLELASQLEDMEVKKNVHIFGVAGRSTAGLVLTSKNLGLNWKTTGVRVTFENEMKEYLYDVVGGAVRDLSLAVGFNPEDMEVLEQYIGEGYGIPTAEVIEAINIMGRTEGLMIDPNYTGTVVAALIDQVRQGNITNDETVVFLHTGGLPAIFSFAEQIDQYG